MSWFSKTLHPCDCGWLSEPINDPSLNLSYDALSNTIGIGHQTRYVLYHCPFCGGKFPDRSKPMWVPIVPGTEFDRIHELTADLTTRDQVFEKLGTPDYESWIYPDVQFKCIEYYELSELLWVEFIVAAAGELVSPIGIKVFGKNLEEMEKLGKEIEAVVKQVPGTTSAFAERITGGFYLNIEPDREQLARYGLGIGDLQDVIGTALGGEMVTTTMEGRERYGVTVRYPRELRSDPEQIARQVLVPTMDGAVKRVDPR